MRVRHSLFSRRLRYPVALGTAAVVGLTVTAVAVEPGKPARSQAQSPAVSGTAGQDTWQMKAVSAAAQSKMISAQAGAQHRAAAEVAREAAEKKKAEAKAAAEKKAQLAKEQARQAREEKARQDAAESRRQEEASRSQKRAPVATPAPAPVTAYSDDLHGWITEALAVMARNGIPGSYDGIHRNIMRES